MLSAHDPADGGPARLIKVGCRRGAGGTSCPFTPRLWLSYVILYRTTSTSRAVLRHLGQDTAKQEPVQHVEPAAAHRPYFGPSTPLTIVICLLALNDQIKGFLRQRQVRYNPA